MAEITVAKVMYLDKRRTAFTVDSDDIRYSSATLRDRVEFVDGNDFNKDHNYFIKWRDCPATCELVHKHWTYYPARILALAETESILQEKSIRFPSINFDDQQLSPVSSQSSSRNTSIMEYDALANHDPDYPVYDTEIDSEDEEEIDNRRLASLARKQKLTEAKKEIQKKRSLANLVEERVANTESALKNSGAVGHEEEIAELNNQQQQLQPLPNQQIAPQLRILDGQEPPAPRGAVGHGEEIAEINNQQQQLQPLPNQQIAPQRRILDGQEPPAPRVRKISYEIKNGQYFVNDNLSIDIDTYDEMRRRPYCKRNLFRHDAIALTWTHAELAVRALNVKRMRKNVPGKCPLTPQKIQLIHDLVCTWYQDEKGIVMTEKKRDLELVEIRKCLRYVTNRSRSIAFPDLVERERYANNGNQENQRED